MSKGQVSQVKVSQGKVFQGQVSQGTPLLNSQTVSFMFTTFSTQVSEMQNLSKNFYFEQNFFIYAFWFFQAAAPLVWFV